MRLTIFLMCFSVLSSLASGTFSQSAKISLDLRQSTIKDALKEIENTTNYFFLYNNNLIDVNKVINVKVENKEIEEVLDLLFQGEDVKYVVMDRQIIITPKTSASSAVSRQSPVGGTVTGDTGEPLPGVTVVIKGTTTGTITDAEGNFSIPVQRGDVLFFTFVGMQKQEVLFDGQLAIKVTMQEEKLALDEVIVIGYGTTKRKDFTGSASTVKMEDSPIALLPNTNALQALKGNVTGLDIGATNSAGGEPSMLIRGQNSISGDNNPLIILDGVIYLGNINDINPNDIASIDVLKDAVTAAVYGTRSANGVIAINTKRGSSAKPVISLNISSGIQSWPNRPEVMKGEQWIEVVNARNQYTEGSVDWMKSGELANYEAGKEINWMDEVTRIGTVQDYQLSVSGAGKGMNYYMSTSYNKTKGVVIGDDFDRISVLGKISTDITDWLKIGVDGSFTRRDYSGFVASVASPQTMSPYGVMYRDEDGNLEKYPYTQSSVNPLWGVDDGTADNTDIRHNYRLNAYASVDIPWIKGLNFRLNYQLNSDQNQSGSFYHEAYYVSEGEGIERYSPSTVQALLAKANGNLNTNSACSYVWDNILSYKNSFGKHNLEGTLVATRDHYRYRITYITGSDFAANGNTALGIWGLHKATTQKVDLYVNNKDINNNTIGGVEKANIGYLGRINYNYDGKYYFTGSYRRDGASVFGINNKWGNFGAFGLAWRMTGEEFMKPIEALNDLKIKVSWGQNGNQGAGPYTTLSTVSNGSSSDIRYQFSDAEGKIYYGLNQTSLGNYDLGWESTSSWNFGFESVWLENRLFVDFDAYLAKTTDEIIKRSLPDMIGQPEILTSLGQVNNRGLELAVKTVNIRQRDLNWTSSVTFWLNRNKLVTIDGRDSDGDGKEDDDITNKWFIGKSLGALYGYKQDGIVQDSDTEYKEANGVASGTPKYVNLDATPAITSADRTILGYEKENFRLNLSNSVTYKNFELYAMVSGIFGGNGYYMNGNAVAYMTSGTGRFNDNMPYKPYWTADRPSNVYPSAIFSGDGRYLALQSRGFVRVQDITLSYVFNQPWTKELNIKSLKLFFSAKNIATFTNWDGGDPETGAKYLENKLPVAATYSIGANVSF
ncbi:MAG: SusC/RagA family TonB-linked outer membrane protein [Mangrovibacterium sp.]|nr:SusC/RagA family TonB-linked outer membrane protein [Mangrovibacterium sp.]